MWSEEKSLAPEDLIGPEGAAEKSLPPEEVVLVEEVVPLGGGYASRIDLDYIIGSNMHCFWARVGGSSYPRWVNADEIRTIVHIAFIAPKVYIQYDSSSKQVQRIRPIKTF